MSLPSLALLAGGKATRLGELASEIPKSLLEVAGKPFLHHQLSLLARLGIREVVACVGHLGKQIQDFAGDGSAWGLKLQYSHDGDSLAGTGGALKKALPLLSDPFFVMYGDSYFEMDLEPLPAALKASGLDALMTVYRNDGLFDSSNVVFEQGRILEYAKGTKNPRMRHIDYGLGLMGHKPFLAESSEAFDLAAVYGKLVQSGRLLGYEVARRFYEIGSQQGLEETNQYLKAK